jgi:hypothetical protein
MKKLYFLLITILFSSFSYGQTLLNENFDYGSTSGDLTTITTNWTGFSGTGLIGYINTSLSITDYPSSGIGGSITIDSSSEDAERGFTAVTSGVVYASALYTASDVSSGANGTYFLTFREGSNYHSLIYTKTDGNGGMVFGVRETTSDAATIFGTTSFALNTTYLLVLKYDFTAGRVSLFVLPSVETTEPMSAEVTTDSGTNATSLSGIAFRQATGGPTATVDGIRIATSWNSIMVSQNFTIGAVTTNCATKGSGATDDTYIVAIDFTGGLNGKNFVLTTNAGNIGGDSPTTSATGTITISNIPEGTDISFTASDTADGGTTSESKSIDSPACIPLIINEVLFDPAGALATDLEGDANGDGTRDSAQDEFIEFYNNSNAPLDISGYKVYDASGLTNTAPRHIFPAATIIPANSFLVLFGGGTPTGTFGGSLVQVASEGALPENRELNLNNAGDVITVLNTSDEVVLTYDSSATGINHGSNESVTRSPDLTGSFVLHTTANAAFIFSPGLKVDGTTLSLNDNNLNTIGIYPNPISKSVQYLNIQSKSSLPINVIIYNVVGRQVDKQNIANNLLNVSKLSAGMYLVKISQGDRTITKKIIKQ